MNFWSRRKFCATTLAGGLVSCAGTILGGNELFAADKTSEQAAKTSVASTRPVIISAAIGLRWLDGGMEILQRGGDPLDAVLAVVTKVEDDPDENSVGYGGLPNEDGVVELDACVMHGPTRRAGAVGSIQKIKNPSLVARAVMERTNHIFLVGEGALRYAVDEGFQTMDLLTEKSRTAWLAWKASTSENWRPGLDSPEWKEKVNAILDAPEKQAWREWVYEVVEHPPTGTINCLAVTEQGAMGGVTTTSGLAWKIPGRVGDSSIIGAGLFLDNDVGGAGSTGRGEENIKIAGGHTIVEMMRKGMSPTDACLEAVQRVVRDYNSDKTRLSQFQITFYALNKDGQHGSASLWASSHTGKRASYAVHDGQQAKLLPCKAFYDAPEGHA